MRCLQFPNGGFLLSGFWKLWDWFLECLLEVLFLILILLDFPSFYQFFVLSLFIQARGVKINDLFELICCVCIDLFELICTKACETV